MCKPPVEQDGQDRLGRPLDQPGPRYTQVARRVATAAEPGRMGSYFAIGSGHIPMDTNELLRGIRRGLLESTHCWTVQHAAVEHGRRMEQDSAGEAVQDLPELDQVEG